MREFKGTTYVNADEVNVYARDEVINTHQQVSTYIGHCRISKDDSFLEVSDINDNPNNSRLHCSERWKNLKLDSEKQTWAIFKETGIFTAVCQHGAV